MAYELVRRKTKGLTPMHGMMIGGAGAVGFFLLAIGIPTFFLIFLGLISYFSWKAFTAVGESANRPIFEFYLRSDRILSARGGQHYGFEINETIALGESIKAMMPDTPPLVYFGLSELYRLRSDLTHANDNLSAAYAAHDGLVLLDEPSVELREHVRSLRHIENSKDDAPSLNAAIRRIDRRFGRSLTERARMRFDSPNSLQFGDEPSQISAIEQAAVSGNTMNVGRKPISDVLHDIYDNA